MTKKVGMFLMCFVALAIVLTLSLSASEVVAQDNDQGALDLRGSKDVNKIEAIAELKEAQPIDKIHPGLRDRALAGGNEQVFLYVSIEGEADMANYLDRVIARPAVFGGVRNVYGTTTANKLMKIAQLPYVLAMVPVGEPLDKPIDPEINIEPQNYEERMALLKANELSYQEALAATSEFDAQGWWDVQDGHKSSDAWEKGFTGDGVVVGVLDDGIDFAHPDLQGTYATVTDPDSAYHGWPMAFSYVSMLYFVNEVYFQDLGAVGITSGWNGSRWSDTTFTVEASTPFEGGTVSASYKPLDSGVSYEYTIPATSASGFYKFGSLHEKNLLSLYGHRVAILVVDEHQSGVYDTVYVDLDNDKDFTDEKPVTQNSPEVYRDMDGDGFADISGGLLVWISDGDNPPPMADWLWGVSCGDEVGSVKACPDSGELLVFAGPFDGGYTHGTACASNVAAQGVVNGGLTAQPFRIGGMVQGAAPDVGLMDFGNHYYSGTDEDEYIVASLGYDGVPNSGDEVQIASNSYGNFTQMWGSWGYYGRLVTALNTTIAPTTVWLFSAGNEGPGYGPQEGDGSPTTIQVGSSTQYGSTNWDSIFSADQIMYGDITAFFAKGPNRDGSSGLDILANGGRGSGDEGINYYGYNGAESWATWGGTSRSAPAAAGNLALVYQAYKDRYGEWPTWQVAKSLIKSGADNVSSSPFVQGGGVVNADRATDLAAGIYGIYAQPDEWQVGDWKGTEYLNFAKVAWPSETYAKTYTVYNPSGYDIDVDLSEGVMTKFDEYETTFTTSDESLEPGFNFHSPDYLMQMDDSLIPPDAELMVIRYVHPYDTFDTDFAFDGSPNSSWRYLFYNWTDINGDGMLWEDRDGNGVVNHVDNLALGRDNDGFYRPDYNSPATEIQEGEYVRVDYNFGSSTDVIMVHNPAERMADGYFFGFQHRNNDGSVPTTTFQIGVEFYKRADWSWLTLSDTDLTIPAEGMATFEAEVTVPVDAQPGAYEGVIFMRDAGDELHAAHETALPVVVNVISDLTDDASFTVGGEPRADTLYDNSNTYGYYTWYGGGWTGAGDWRHYFFNIDEADLENGDLLLHTSWDTGYPTDFNTWVLGPTNDCASNGVGACAWYEPGLGQPNQSIYGPYTLQPIGNSEPFRSGTNYPFWTSTGGPDDWLKVPMTREGLHEIALHNVLFEGDSLTTGVQVDVGTILMDVDIDPDVGIGSVGSINAEVYTDSGEIEVNFTPTLELPDLTATLAGGLATDVFGPFTSNVPDAGGTYDPWDSNNVYEPIVIDQVGATELGIHLSTPEAQDPDMFLIYDVNDNGVPEQGIDQVVGSSGNSTGTDEEIVLTNPDLGRYFVVLHGFDVDPDSGVDMDWEYWVTYPGDLSTDAMEWYSDTISIDQNVKFDPTTASYSMTVMTTERTANLHFYLSDIPSDSDVDLYLSDDSGILAKSQNTGDDDEHIMWVPDANEYRLGEGHEYTIWVHGFDVPDGPITPHLRVWSDELNLWLSASHPDVHVSEIGVGETVSMTVNFAKEGWEPGDADLSARLLVGSSVMADAFDELMVIERTNEPPPAEWNPDNLSISITADSDRGISPVARWNVGGGPIPTALVAAGENVTYTVTIENFDSFNSPNLYVDIFPLPWDYICTYFGLCSDQVDGVDYGLISSPPGAGDYGLGIDWSGVIPSGNSIEFSYWVEMPADMLPGENHTSGLDVYVGTSYLDPWIGWALAGGYNRAFGFGLEGYKMSNPSVVAPGDTFSYEISLMNPTAGDHEVMLSDPLPANVDFVSATPGMDYDAGTHTVTWEGILPGTTMSSLDFEIVVTADSGLDEDSMLWNTATLFGKYYGEQLAAMTASTLIDDDLDPDVTVEKSVDKLTERVGNELAFTIVVSNEGDETAEDVHLMDVIPDTLDYVEGSLTGGATHTAGVVEWTGDLAPGASHEISFKATIGESATEGLAIINAAEAAAETPFDILSDYNSSVTEVIPMVKLYLPIVYPGLE